MSIWKKRTKTADVLFTQVKALIALANQNNETVRLALDSMLKTARRTDALMATMETFFRSEIAARQREKEEADKRKPTAKDLEY